MVYIGLWSNLGARAVKYELPKGQRVKEQITERPVNATIREEKNELDS